MSSLDVRDMLDLPSSAGPRPAKKQKALHPRPNLKGLQREVQSLGGDNPIAIVPAVPLFKKRRLASRKPAARWELRPFRNSAREDELVLRHWRRKAEGAEEAKGEGEAQMEDSMFAKFNVQVDVPSYEDEQYEKELKSEEWSKEETDYLMGLVRDFDLRWPVIWDRYEYTPGPPPGAEADSQALVPEVKPRSLEDLKARYYEVAAKMMAVHRPVQYMSQVEFSLHQLMSSFNPQQEILRKRFAEAAMSRSPEDRKEEENLLIELKRIMARTERLNEERKDLYARLEAPPSTSNVGIYTTSAGLQQLVQQLMTADKSKKRKTILGPEATPASATAAAAAPADRKDSAVREAPAPTPTPAAAAKKGPAGPVERKKLSEEEEAVFGVSRHDRLQSGPQFRHERVSKLINGRSAVVAGRINNILTELEVPPRLVMPTQEVTREFEGLLGSISVLLDTRKVADKLDAEIKVAEAQKAEREKKERKEKGEAEGEVEEKAGGEEGTVKAEEGEKVAPAVAAAGKAASVHKRSASVLSQVSDKSTKRQKK
jgi:DNA methyltransferase 1-associated protein 1